MYLFHIFRSFVPLRNPLGFGVSDLLEMGMALLALLAIFGYAYAGKWLANAARRTAWCMLALFVLPIALRLALLPQAPVPVATTSEEFSSLLEAREAYERDYILKKLDEFHGNVSRAAEGLGLERSHLYRKMKALGVSIKE